MKDLVKIDAKEKLTLDSREVAELVGKRHDHLMRDIERYSQYISKSNDPKVGAVENFFIKSTYVDAKGQTRPNYRITKKGCEFIAHKLTGEKGTLFTAAYINRFHEMEEGLKQAYTVLTEEQKLQLAIFQAKTPEEAAMAAASLDRYRRLQLEEKQREIEHKNEVIKGITDDVDVYTKRAILNRVVRYKGANFKERWDELYRTFRETYSIDLKARCEGYNLKQTKEKDKLSVVKYAEKFGYIHDLYKVALKLYETDINEILKKIKNIA